MKDSKEFLAMIGGTLTKTIRCSECGCDLM